MSPPTAQIAAADVPVGTLKELRCEGGGAVVVGHLESGFFAVAARCTHEAAPMRRAKIVDGTLVCPWHKVAFDIATGAPSGPPATVPLPIYDVEVRDGVVHIGPTGER